MQALRQRHKGRPTRSPVRTCLLPAAAAMHRYARCFDRPGVGLKLHTWGRCDEREGRAEMAVGG